MSKTKLSKSDLVVIALCVFAVVAFVVLQLVDLQFVQDNQINVLATDVLQRVIVCAVVVAVCCTPAFVGEVGFCCQNLGKQLLCLLPCLAVAVANFPFSALANGTATVDKTQYVWLFLIQCALIGVIEELFFRGIVVSIVKQRLSQSTVFVQVLLNGAIFALWHLVNLLFGASFGATMLQVGYSFLIGAMLCVLKISTNNVLWCVLVHALFDVGGTIVSTLGSGQPWDGAFWIATVVCGVCCAVWCVAFVVNEDKKRSKKQIEQDN